MHDVTFKVDSLGIKISYTSQKWRKHCCSPGCLKAQNCWKVCQVTWEYIRGDLVDILCKGCGVCPLICSQKEARFLIFLSVLWVTSWYLGAIILFNFPKTSFSVSLFSLFFAFKRNNKNKQNLRCFFSFLFPKTHLTVVKSTLTGTQIN